MNNVVYTRESFQIIKVNNGYIVYNSKKEFKEGHTHLKSFKASKDLITFCANKRIPKKCRDYYLDSLIRITSDKVFIMRIQELKEVRRNKGKQKYYNVNKGV